MELKLRYTSDGPAVEDSKSKTGGGVLVSGGVTLLPADGFDFGKGDVWLCDAEYPEYRIKTTMRGAIDVLSKLSVMYNKKGEEG